MIYLTYMLSKSNQFYLDIYHILLSHTHSVSFRRMSRCESCQFRVSSNELTLNCMRVEILEPVVNWNRTIVVDDDLCLLWSRCFDYNTTITVMKL